MTGLGGHALHTWQRDENENWLRDFLPKDFPTSKVWTYGYDSRLNDCETQHGTYEMAETLTTDLETHCASNKVKGAPFQCPYGQRLTPKTTDHKSHTHWT